MPWFQLLDEDTIFTVQLLDIDENFSNKRKRFKFGSVDWTSIIYYNRKPGRSNNKF